MLSAQAYSFRMKSRLAISLSWVGGYVNAVTFLVCGTMSSHVTGNTTIALLRDVEGQQQLAGYAAFAVLAFLAGTVLSAVLTEGARRAGWRSKYVLPIAAEGVLLFLLALEMRRTASVYAGQDDAWWAMVGLAAGAMGVQNATITRVSGSVIRTTHMTGVVTDIGLESVQVLHRWRNRVRTSSSSLRGARLLRIARREPSVLRVLLLLSIFGSFVFGAAAGAAAYYWNPAVAMLPPLLFLALIVWVDVRSPIADVRELDALADVAVAGTLRELLPATVGVYRLHSGGRHGAHRSPDFLHWAERLPATWRVVVLCFNPLVKIDEDSAHGLRSCIEMLRHDGRHLVVAGISRPQYAAFERFGVFRVLSRDDAWSDVEFALARATTLAASETATD